MEKWLGHPDDQPVTNLGILHGEKVLQACSKNIILANEHSAGGHARGLRDEQYQCAALSKQRNKTCWKNSVFEFRVTEHGLTLEQHNERV